MAIEAFALGPDEGKAVWSLGGRFTLKLTGSRSSAHRVRSQE